MKKKDAKKAAANGNGTALQPASLAAASSQDLDIDWDLVKSLAMIQCTVNEISAILRIRVDCLSRSPKFVDTYCSGIEYGKMIVRRMQFIKGREGNVPMLIHLGKQYLGQQDRPGDSPTRLFQPEPPQSSLSRLSVDELRKLQELVLKATPELADAEVIDVSG